MKNKKLIKIIDLIVGYNKSEFTGLGLICYNTKNNLPIESMNSNCCLNEVLTNSYEICDKLIKISSANNNCHDGFHLMNKDFQLTDLSYYFSTPISLICKPKLKKGSRYRTAFYGSLLEDIICTISISSNFETYIFINGKEYTLDDYRML